MNENGDFFYIYGGSAVVALVIVFVILLIWTLQGNPLPNHPTPTLYVFPTAEQEASATLTSTASPEPTLTNTAPPTKTAVPTATVNIEATQQTEAAGIYLALFDDYDQTARLTKQRFESTFGQLIEGKVNEHDSTWKSEVAALLVTFDGHIAQMRGLTVPAGYEAAHDMVIYGMERCSIGWRGMYNATQAGDHDAYDAAIPYVHECSESWEQGENMIANLRR